MTWLFNRRKWSRYGFAFLIAGMVLGCCSCQQTKMSHSSDRTSLYANSQPAQLEVAKQMPKRYSGTVPPPHWFEAEMVAKKGYGTTSMIPVSYNAPINMSGSSQQPSSIVDQSANTNASIFSLNKTLFIPGLQQETQPVAKVSGATPFSESSKDHSQSTSETLTRGIIPGGKFAFDTSVTQGTIVRAQSPQENSFDPNDPFNLGDSSPFDELTTQSTIPTNVANADSQNSRSQNNDAVLPDKRIVLSPSDDNPFENDLLGMPVTKENKPLAPSKIDSTNRSISPILQADTAGVVQSSQILHPSTGGARTIMSRQGYPTEVDADAVPFNPRKKEVINIDSTLKDQGKSIIRQSQMQSYVAPENGRYSETGLFLPWPSEEYLFDGGDARKRAYVRDGWDVQGLDVTDTIAHYDTLDQRVLVTPSNRVQIYSPRFGSVRKIDSIAAYEQLTGYGTVDHATHAITTESRMITGRTENEQVALYARNNTLLRSATTRTGTGETSSPKIVASYVNQEQIASLSKLLTHRSFSNAEMAYLAERKMAAVAWGGLDRVEVIVNELAARATIATKSPEAIYIVDNRGVSAPQLKLFKVASTDTAQRGEIVEFMIRFDNTGNELVGNVTILDSLTPRLEYIAGSSGASVAAEFFVEENESGASILRWEITNPLEPGDYGVVRFRCRVQ